MPAYKATSTARGREHQEQCYARRQSRNQSLNALLGCLDEQLLGTLTAIRALTEDDQLSDAEKVERIRALLGTRESGRCPEQAFEDLRAELENEMSEDEYFSILEARSIRIQNRINPILRMLTFQGESGAQGLLDALQYFKDRDGAIDKSAPVGFLKPHEHEVVAEDGRRFRVSLYKALLFLHVQSAIKSGTLNLVHSYKYRPLDEYLIDRARWCRDREGLLERAGLQLRPDRDY